MTLRTLERPLFTEYYLTAIGPWDRTSEEAARAVFSDLANAQLAHGIEPFQQKVYGPAEDRTAVLAAREAALASAGLDPSTPCTFTDGRRGEGRGPVAAQVWGIVPRPGSNVHLRTVEGPLGQRGRLLTGPGVRALWLSGVVGVEPDGRLNDWVTAQAERMFCNADACLRQHGFSYRDVARTWIYVRRLLDWYGELNRVRTAFHERHGITGGHPFPASTGIQGASGTEECLMDVLAIQVDAAGGAAVRPLARSARQDQAVSYGSAFSRAMHVSMAGAHTLMVSGTASIGGDGRTLYVGDREGQVMQTLLSIAALVEQLGGGLAQVGFGTIFYRDIATLRAYQQVTRLLGVPDLPLVPVLADVCRDDLLVEIEAVALIPA